MNRIRSLDLARGFTVFFIPAIHTGMLYSRLIVHKSVLGIFLIAIAEGPGGQMLMLLMGVSFALKSDHTFKSILARAFWLLILGYLLNTLKFVWPYEFGWLPAGVLEALGIHKSDSVTQRLFSMGDILHFAAIAQCILYGLYRLRNYQWWAFVGAATIAVLSPLLWDRQPALPVLHYLAGLATGRPPKVFFPLFPWLVYPLTGLCIGYYLKQDQPETMKRCGITGIILLTGGFVWQLFNPVVDPDGFYRTPVNVTCWHLGVVLVCLSCWHLIATRIRSNLFFDLLSYSSKNITLIYLIQWVMICWLLPVFGFRELDAVHSAIVMTVTTADTYILTFFINRIKQRYEHNKSF
ncbi:heparan-alpha-glucosaminide N-acetyltransferase domain-containing protein [Niabella aurantiaca]|uniref:heparan-alpha-glucosaminide N-acetyltransferase domain-containing protein n=1 Tax=Niabella aurantiaca TaxID=379900 RepID=UPI00037A9177|nr:heparan-alpha-glucosaminide N-acetyltransferase domain-containing protein [Niabella aurantiaca]